MRIAYLIASLYVSLLLAKSSFAGSDPLLSGDLISPATSAAPSSDSASSSISTPSVSNPDSWNFWSSPLTPVTLESIATRSFYVSKTGSDTGDGSQTNPWRTIRRGVSQLVAGDTLYIQAGTYEENVDMVSSGGLNAYITLEGIGQVILDGTNLADSESGIETNGRDFLRFKNLEFRNLRAGIDVEASSIYVEIDGLRADGNDYAVRITDAHHVTVKNAYATNSKNAFRATGISHTLLFEQVQAYNSLDIFPGSNPDYLNGDGLIAEAQVDQLTVRNSIFGNNADAGIDFKGTNGLFENIEVYGNKNNFKMWGTATIKSSLSHHAKRQVRSDGSTVEGNGITVEDGNTTVIQTTFVSNEDHDIRIYAGGTLRLENSIVARGISDGLLFESNGSFSSSRVLWYSAGIDLSSFTLSSTDFRANPEFVNWAGGDFRLKQTSLAIDYVPVTTSLSLTDLDAKPRAVGIKSDLGAYEYQTPLAPAFTPLTNGDTVSGTIFIGPNLSAYPTVSQVSYYVDGKKLYSTKTKPFTWGGSKGYNTKNLKNGTHLLTGVFRIGGKDYRFSLIFIVSN